MKNPCRRCLVFPCCASKFKGKRTLRYESAIGNIQGLMGKCVYLNSYLREKVRKQIKESSSNKGKNFQYIQSPFRSDQYFGIRYHNISKETEIIRIKCVLTGDLERGKINGMSMQKLRNISGVSDKL